MSINVNQELRFFLYVWLAVRNTTYKKSMYEMPLIFKFGVLGLGRAFFVLGFWVLTFCHWRFFPEIMGLPHTESTIKILKRIALEFANNFYDLLIFLTHNGVC